MEILKQLVLKNRKNPVKKKFIATAVGHAPWGVGVAEYFYNLYEYPDGTREYEAFDGGQYHDMPENADYSTKAQVKAWIYGGNVPRNVLNIEPLIDEVNKKIKECSLIVEMYDPYDEPILKTKGMEKEIEEFFRQKFKKSKNKKAVSLKGRGFLL